MASRDSERYYWLKLHKDFFKRHDISVVEDMPNGKDYVLFYLKLMLESVDHEGALRFSDTIPYSEAMLASVTRTNVDIVRSALKVFIELGMVEVFDDQTLFLRQVAELLDSETFQSKRKREMKHSLPQIGAGVNFTPL
jgi:predicted phage replisome organizer